MAYANITFKGVAIAAPVPFGMVTSLNGHGGHHAACARWPQGLSPFCAESAGTLLAPQKKTLYFFAGFRYTETNGRKQSL